MTEVREFNTLDELKNNLVIGETIEVDEGLGWYALVGFRQNMLGNLEIQVGPRTYTPMQFLKQCKRLNGKLTGITN